MGYGTDVGTGVDRAGVVGGRAKSLVVTVVSVACQAVAVVCLTYMAYRTATGTDRAGTAEGARNNLVTAAACVYWRA